MTIDITAQFVDNTTNSAQKLITFLDKLDAKINKLAGAEVDLRIGFEDSAFEKKYQKTEQKVKKLQKSKASVLLDAVDNASKKIGAATSKAEQFAKKVFRASLGVVDGASKAVSRIAGTVKGIVGTGYNFTLGVIDKVTAPVRNIIGKMNSVLGLAGLGLSGYGLVVKPIQMQVDYENLTTAFDVLLGGEDKAQNRIEELTSFAGKTPFTRDEIYKANRILQVYTGDALGATNAMGGVKMVGDIAAGTESDFTSVATWVGRLYSAMEGGKPIGEMSAALQDMGALSSSGREKLEALTGEVESGAKTIKEAWPEAVGVFSKFDGIMEKQSNKLGNLLLGVKSFVTNNFLKKIGSGISDELSPALMKFRDWRGENSDLIGKWASQVEDFAAAVTGKGVRAVEALTAKVSGMRKTKAWENADFFGKVQISWDTLVGDPFSDWWDGKGKKLVAKKLTSIGSFLGRGATVGLSALLGLNPNGAIDDGAELGSAFIRGFKNSFGRNQIELAFERAVENLPRAAENLWEKVTGAFDTLKISWDKNIAEPFMQWWGSGGKETFTSAASQAGTWLGEGITHGIQFLSSGVLSLLGIENDGVLSEAADVGKGFWDSFTKAIDGDAISDAIAEAISGVWGKLPGWAKMLIGGYGIGKAAGAISPVINAGRGINSAVKSVTGLFMKGEDGSSGGIGLLSLGGKLLKKLGGSKVGKGLGAAAGAIEAANVTYSGVNDIIAATQTEGKESDYNGWKAGSKLGGVGVGAIIGSIIAPGPGTLIGAGLGGLIGDLASDPLAEAVTGYNESLEEYEKRMEGINSAMKNYSESSKEAIRKTKLTGEHFQQIERNKLAEWYGNVSLSAQEAGETAERAFTDIVGASTLRRVQEYQSAIEKTKTALASMEDSWNTSQNLGWKIQAGITLSEGDQDSYVSAVESYVAAAQEYISGKQYSVSLAMNLILGTGENGEENPMVGQTEDYFGGLQEQVGELKEKIHTTIQEALDENDDTPFVIDINEQQIIDEYQQQVAAITEKLNTSGMEAKFERLKLQYGGAELDPESKEKISADLDSEKETLLTQYQDAFELSVQAQLMLYNDGEISKEELDANIEELTEKYNGQKITLEHQVEGFKLELSEDAYGNIAEDATGMMEKIDGYITDAAKNFDFSSTAEMLANGLMPKDEHGAIDWDAWFDTVFMTDTLSTKIDGIKGEAAAAKEQLLAAADEYKAAGLDVPDRINEGISAAAAVENFQVPTDVMWGNLALAINNGDTFGEVKSILMQKSMEAVGTLGDTLGTDPEGKLASGASSLYSNAGTELESAFSSPFNISADVNVNLIPHVNGTSVSIGLDGGNGNSTITIGEHASGGFVHGKQLSWLDEENYGESIIPFNPARRSSALDIWYESGRRLGVDIAGYASGGFTGRYQPEPVSMPKIPRYTGESAAQGQAVDVTVKGVEVHIHVDGANGDVVEQVKARAGEIAEALAGAIADGVKPVLDNTPVTA